MDILPEKKGFPFFIGKNYPHYGFSYICSLENIFQFSNLDLKVMEKIPENIFQFGNLDLCVVEKFFGKKIHNKIFCPGKYFPYINNNILAFKWILYYGKYFPKVIIGMTNLLYQLIIIYLRHLEDLFAQHWCSGVSVVSIALQLLHGIFTLLFIARSPAKYCLHQVYFSICA